MFRKLISIIFAWSQKITYQSSRRNLFAFSAGGIVEATGVLTPAIARSSNQFSSVDSTVNVKNFGATGDGINDDTDAIQSAIDSSDNIFVPHSNSFYRITKPLYLSSSKSLCGETGRLPRIVKTTNIAGSGSNTFGSHNDGYDKDAVLIITHTDNSYTTYVNIENLSIGSNCNCRYIVYAPRMYVGAFRNLILELGGGQYGFVTHDTFMFTMDSIQVAGDNSNHIDSVGFWWDDQKDGSSGTSVSFNRCWVRDGVGIAYKFRGLVYSSMIACGTDKFLKHAIHLDLCDLSINGFGFENRVKLADTPIIITRSRVNLNSLVGFSVNLAPLEFLIEINGGVCNIRGLRHTVTKDGLDSGRSFLITDSAIVNVSGLALGNIKNLKPKIDSSSTINNIDSNTIIGKNTNPNIYGGGYILSDRHGTELGSLSSISGLGIKLIATGNGNLYFGNQNSLTLCSSKIFFSPLSNDNLIDLGCAAYRWRRIYAYSGLITEADKKDKVQVRAVTSAEKTIALNLKSKICAYKYSESVKKSRNDAKVHIGIHAQDVIEAFLEQGLDAHNYALLCYEEWGETTEQRDEDGKVIIPAQPAGSHLGVRNDELLAFMLAAL